MDKSLVDADVIFFDGEAVLKNSGQGLTVSE